jgi:DNA repair ATPase RecN
MSIADTATHTDHEIGAEVTIARQRAEIERLRAKTKADAEAWHEQEEKIDRLRGIIAEYDALFEKLPRLKDHLSTLTAAK